MRHHWLPLLALTTLIACCIGDSSAQWYQQNSGTTSQLNGVSFYNADHGVAVGDGGTILLTGDGGTNWTSHSSLTNSDLYSVSYRYILDEKDIGSWVAVGSEGTIICNHNLATSGTTHRLSDVFLTDIDNGWIVGDSGTVLRTTNRGADWTPQTSGTVNDLLSVWFIDHNTGWIGGNAGTILKTTDGGNNWINQGSGTDFRLNSICFVDQDIGWVTWTVGPFLSGGLLKTTNGGATWLPIFQNPGDIEPEVFFTDINNGWLIGAGFKDFIIEPMILKTTDGGANWSLNYDFGPETQLVRVGLFFTDSLNGWVAAYDGTILHTTNGGVTSVEGDEREEVPTDFALSQNYPNPFNPTTTITYTLPRSALVRLSVYNTLGEEVATLISEQLPAGTHQTEWNASNQPSGVYFYRLQAEDFVQTRKLVLLK